VGAVSGFRNFHCVVVFSFQSATKHLVCLEERKVLYAPSPFNFSSQDSASLSRRAAGLGTWRCRGMELRRCAAGGGTSRYGDLEPGRHAVGLVTWRYVEV